RRPPKRRLRRRTPTAHRPASELRDSPTSPRRYSFAKPGSAVGFHHAAARGSRCAANVRRAICATRRQNLARGRGGAAGPWLARRATMHRITVITMLGALTAACTSSKAPTREQYDDTAQAIASTTATGGGGGDVGSMSDSVTIALGTMPAGFS